jgi:hypothetical protein
MDNTSQKASIETLVSNQETLEAALAEPIEAEVAANTEEVKTVEPEPKMYLGKYKSPDDLAEAYRSLQSEFTKRNEELKTIRANAKKQEVENLKSLGYDEQVQYLVDEIQRLKDQQEEQTQQVQLSSQEAQINQDKQSLEAFIASKPELIETGMDDIFRELALSPNYAEYTFDSIFDSRLKPKLEKLMGTKVSVRERPLKGQTKSPEKSYENVGSISKSEYEKNRIQIMREAGIKI